MLRSTPYERALAHPKVGRGHQAAAARARIARSIPWRCWPRSARRRRNSASASIVGRRRGPRDAARAIGRRQLDRGRLRHSLEGSATITRGEPRATHRRPKRRYKKRIRMPSKLDPHLATIESWLATEPQLTALAIVGRLARAPSRPVRRAAAFDRAAPAASLAQDAAQRLIAETAEGRTRPAAARGCGRLGLCEARPAHSPSPCSSPQR